MTRGTAAGYWAATAEGYFESMRSVYRPGERSASAVPADRPARRGLAPLTASQGIVDAIAACAPLRDAQGPEPEQAAARQRTVVALE